MAWCSTAEVMTCLPLRELAARTPCRARLFDSEPPEVKMTSSGSVAPIRRAMVARARSMARRVSCAST